MIDVTRDIEGVRLAFAEIFEREFERARIARSLEHAGPETRERLLASVSPLRLSPGYHRLADHLFELESRRDAGVPPGDLFDWQARCLVALKQARAAFEVLHPACGACGTRKTTRFAPECLGCGAKFRRKK